MRSRQPLSNQSVVENEAAIPRIQINVLGKFKLTRGETPVTEKEWNAAKKPQMLLKALITRGAENVLSDLLIEDLWPNGTPDDGKRNFRVVLHRLRKTLGHLARSESPYISLDKNTVSMNRNLVSLDIDEFLSFCKSAKRADQAGDVKGSIGFGNSAIELYKGDYLEDELYTPWAMLKREETRALYLDVLRRTASLYERQGNSRKSIDLYKLLIKADPVLEEAYRKLMSLHSNIGMRSEALRVYEECRRVLDRELGVEPDNLTTSLYRRIVESGRSDKEREVPDFDRPRSYTPKYLAEKILTSRSSIEGERKTVTVMFADVANFTAIFEDLEIDVVHEIMGGCFRILLDEVHRFEGTINQFLGDGVMALFGAPLAHEDHVQRACHAALSIQSSLAPYAETLKNRYGIDFKMRIGLNSGPVVVGSIGNDLRMDYTAQGDTVNLAEGMASQAKAGEVLVTNHLFKLVREYFEFEPVGNIQARTLGKPIDAHRLIKSTEVETKFAAAAAARGLTRFVGRTREFRILQEAFDKTRSGEGRVIGIAGEAGVGKSRLLLEFKNSLPQGEYRYLEGRCFHYGKSMPYLPMLDVLRSYIGVREGEQEHIVRQKLEKRILGLDKKLRNVLSPFQELLSLKVEDEEYAKLEPKQKRERTFQAIRDLFIRGSRVRPTVLAIEDLHWIDRTTEELLEHMITWLPDARILLILLHRNEYTHNWGDKPCYSEIKLGQLSEKRSTELVGAILEGGTAAPELKELIIGRSAGNPFFMEELTFAMLENGSIRKKDQRFVLDGDISGMEVPDTIQGVIAARMDRLEEDLKRIVQIASVMGREFTFRILERISEMKEGLSSRLASLQRLEFILKKSLLPEIEYIFRHALTQEVAYKSLLVQRRREIHERIGEAIEDLYPQRLEEFYEMLAYHYAKGEVFEKASRYLKLSGNKAARRQSAWEAYNFYKEALFALRRLPETAHSQGQKLEVLVLTATPMLLLGFPEHSLDLLREGEAVSKEIGDSRRLAFFYGRLGAYYVFRGNHLLGAQYSEDALKEGRKSEDLDLIVSVAHGACVSCFGTGQIEKVVATARDVLDLIENKERQFDSFDMPGNPYALFSGYCGIGLGWMGNFQEAGPFLEKGLHHAARIGDLRMLAMIEFHSAYVCRTMGDWKATVEHVRMSIKHSEAVKFMVILCWDWSILGDAYTHLGDPGKGKAYVEKGLKMQQDAGIEWFLCMPHLYLADTYLHLGDPENARCSAEHSLRLSQDNNEKYMEAAAWILLGRILGQTESPQVRKAEECMLRGMGTAHELKLKPLEAEGHFHLGELSASSGRITVAKEHLRKAEAMFRQMGMDYWLVKAQKAQGELL